MQRVGILFQNPNFPFGNISVPLCIPKKRGKVMTHPYTVEECCKCYCKLKNAHPDDYGDDIYYIGDNALCTNCYEQFQRELTINKNKFKGKCKDCGKEGTIYKHYFKDNVINLCKECYVSYEVD